MIPYPIPPGLTQDQFNDLVTDLYYQLTKHGLDPAFNMIVEDHDEVLDDSTSRIHFSIIISEDAAKVLLEQTTGKELVDKASLATWLTHEIRKYPGCERCTIVNVYKLREGLDNPNWSIGAFMGDNPDLEACQANLDMVKQLAIERFELA